MSVYESRASTDWAERLDWIEAKDFLGDRKMVCFFDRVLE